MPNWVNNVVKMKGITKLDVFSEDENGEKFFDFNKLIPMPESLNMESGSYEDIAMEAVIRKVQEKASGSMCASLGLSRARMTGRFQERMEIYCKEKGEEKIYEDGLAYISNIVKYGNATWYGWCSENWGTKWNSCGYEEEDEDTITFRTAWAMPESIIMELSKKYPGVEVEISWADEDPGSNVGKATYKDGELIDGGFFDTQSKEAYEMYIMLHGENPCLAKDENGDWYHKDCDDCTGCD